MIRIENLVKSYGRTKVLNKLNLEVKTGEIYGFIGRNGEGKSTTMNILNRIINFQSGVCMINDKDIKKAIIKPDDIGYLPEDPKFYNYMTCKEYLNFIGKISKDSAYKIQEKIKKLLKLVNLENSLNKKIGNFSRGMRQRLGVATAIYNNPKTLILDEPSSALDPEGRIDIIKIISLLKREGKTVFISTHILNDIERICDRIGIIKDGKIIIEDTLNDIMHRYIQPIYDIEYENPVDSKYIENLKSLKFVKSISTNLNKLSVSVNNVKLDGRALMKEVVDSGCTPISITQRKSSLEDIFIKVANNL
jgi:ABC-2 type transport system ATP-binding protein